MGSRGGAESSNFTLGPDHRTIAVSIHPVTIRADNTSPRFLILGQFLADKST